jgi:Protein of unknown function (DUF2818)
VSQTASIWLVIVAGFVAANLPFVLDRHVLAVWPLKVPKSLGVRLAELVAWYFIVGAIGLALENRVGQIAPQRWEFYAITGALFLTFAFPGFVWRYLRKHRRA